MLVASAVIVPLLVLDGVVSRPESAALLLVALGYTLWMVRTARSAAAVASAGADAAVLGDAADVAGAPAPTSALRAGLTAVAGLLVLLVGGNLFVDGAVSLAHVLGMSERLVGLTIVAVGTSLPELVTSVIAARRGHSDIAVGNVVGSNIFNTFLCLGTAGLAGSVGAPLAALHFDIAALVVMTGLAAAFIRSERTITRVEGGVALIGYVTFVIITIARG